MRRRGLALLGAGSACLLVVGTAGTATADSDVVLPVTHQVFDIGRPGAQDAAGGGSPGQAKNASGYLCTASGDDALNRRTDCEGNAPDNETTIAANPTDARNLVAGANDYQLTVTGGHTYETALSRAHVSTDGGRTWSEYAVPWLGSGDFTGDPAIAFDADGRAYYATLSFNVSQGSSPVTTAPDVQVSTSTDGGHTWTRATRVAQGSGSSGSVGRFLDKEYVAAWGHGNAIVTFTTFFQGPHGAYLSSPIYDTVTHDGGATWSTPVQISGSAPFCTGSGQGSATACDQDQVSVPTVTPNGRILVGFENGPAPGSPDFDDQYLDVEVSPATGQLVAGPFQVDVLQDGTADYPLDAQGRQTYHDSQFRTWSAGNIAADPSTPGRLALTWSDMRNSPSRDTGQTDPYTTATNSDVFVSFSSDYGRTWSAAQKLPDGGATAISDQWFPWAAFAPNGTLGITFQDRSYDSANHLYGQTLATAPAGSAVFASRQVSTALSDPTRDNRWFAVTVDPAFPYATTFIGDYTGLAWAPDGTGHPIWTDLRNDTTFAGRTGHDEQTVTATVPAAQ